MPSWQPNWSDVRFDHANARAAVDELCRCATLLDSQTDRRVVLARRAQAAWRGRSRDQFDNELSRITATAAWLADAMRRSAVDIEDAAAEATREQRRRESARAQWWDEKRVEDARRADQGLPPSPGPVRTPTRAF